MSETLNATAAIEARLPAELHKVAPEVVAWRRHLHRNPELSFEEHETARYIAEALREIGLRPRSLTPTSVVADLEGTRPGRTIAVRGDIDALPVQEETGLPFASQRPGVMHACGHDGHAAVVLGVASVLNAVREELPGRFRFIFQHAEELQRPEELGPLGAQEMIDAGVLDGVDAIVAQHLLAIAPVGTVALAHGRMLASADQFDVEFSGHGGHGAMPQASRDPIAAVAEFIQAMQRLVAREVDPLEPAVVSVTQVDAGQARNVIPERARLGGTVRAFDGAMRTFLRERIAELAAQVAATHRIEAEVRFDSGPPPLHNADAIVEVFERVAGRCDGMTVRTLDPLMGGDDYACYLERVPGAYAFVGACRPDDAEPFMHHHPRFYVDEDALAIATELLVRTAVELADPAVKVDGLR